MAKRLQILFYGMACFVRVRGGGHKVFFPDGREQKHIAGVWVRKKKKTAVARWQWISFNNDFFYAEMSNFEISGTKKTELDARDFEGFLINLKDCAPDFKLAPNPKVMGTLRHVDHGKLSAHVINAEGQVVVQWQVDVPKRGGVRLDFGKNFIEPPPDIDQVVLANCKITGFSPGKFSPFIAAPPVLLQQVDTIGVVSFGPDETDDFQIYRTLSTNPNTPLVVAPSAKMPKSQDAPAVMEPDDFWHWETPDKKCSPVAYC